MIYIITLLAWISVILKFVIVGAYIQKWKMQAVFNYQNISKIAPVYEVNFV